MGTYVGPSPPLLAMPHTYDAVLHGDRIEWSGAAPDAAHPVRVQVTVLEASTSDEARGRAMADALRRLAALDPFADVDNPAAWQRAQRADRPLPGRP